MAETSKARVTITLGRSGQVVKRAATSSDGGYSNSLHSGSGTKRSVMDRLGSNSDISSSSGRNKRQRGDSSLTSLGSNGVEDVCIGKDDLRYKLMRKNVFRRAESDDDQKPIDLREKLSRTTRPPPGPPPRAPRPSSIDSQQRRPPEPKDANMLTGMPPTRSADDLHQMDLSRNSYSAWTLDHIRRRSPERVIGTSRGLSPPRNMEDLQRRPVNRTYDDVRSVPYMNKDILDTPRSVTSSSAAFMAKPALPPPIASAKPVAPSPLMGQLPPPSGIVQKTSYVVEEPQTVDGLLNSLGLGKYAILFKAEEVDMTALKQMGESDLKELGIPMGPRKKILLALLPRSKRQP